MKFLTRAMVAASAVAMLATTTAKADSPDLGNAGSATVLTALSTGPMTITFLHARAEFTNYLVLFTAVGGTAVGGAPLIQVIGNYPNVGVGNPPSVVINVTAGQTLLFGICSSGGTGGAATACTNIGAGYGAYYTGPAANNNDNALHAIVTDAVTWNAAATGSGCLAESPPCFLAAAGTTVVGFEDLPNLGDADWNDLVFSFTNVATVPEPGTMGLLALGLVGLSGAGVIRRRRNK